MYKRRTKEEKENLLAAYKSSGLSMAKWCLANDIPTSTFSAWVNGKKSSASTSRNNAKFVEVILKEDSPTYNTSNIIVEYKSFKITVPSNIEVGTLEKTLKAVVQSDV